MFTNTSGFYFTLHSKCFIDLISRYRVIGLGSNVSVKAHSENKGRFLTIKKTKIVDTDRCKKTSDITVDRESVGCLENFEYLGSKSQGNGKCSNEIKRRTAMAAGQLNKMEIIWKGQDKQTKLKIVRACIFPTAIYGCEGWTLTTADEKKINFF